MSLQNAPTNTRENMRPAGFASLGSIFGNLKAYLGMGSAVRIQPGSTSEPVAFKPLSKRQATKIWHDARRFERQTREPGHQDGAVGRNGLAVLHAMLFDFLNHATGRLDPTRATLARAACVSIRSVDRGLAKLKGAGMLDWRRRFDRSTLVQVANAYFVHAQTAWRGFWRPPEMPALYPEAWGATPPLLGPIEMAAKIRVEGGSLAAQREALTCDPRDDVANALGRLLGAISARKP